MFLFSSNIYSVGITGNCFETLILVYCGRHFSVVFVFSSDAPRTNRDVRKSFVGRGGKIRGVLGLVTERKLQVQTVLFPETEPLVATENVTELSVIMPTDLNYCEVLHTMHFRIARISLISQQYFFNQISPTCFGALVHHHLLKTIGIFFCGCRQHKIYHV